MRLLACSLHGVVSAHVSAPYAIAGSTHELQICLFKRVPMLPLKMSRRLAEAGVDLEDGDCTKDNRLRVWLDRSC